MCTVSQNCFVVVSHVCLQYVDVLFLDSWASSSQNGKDPPRTTESGKI